MRAIIRFCSHSLCNGSDTVSSNELLASSHGVHFLKKSRQSAGGAATNLREKANIATPRD